MGVIHAYNTGIPYHSTLFPIPILHLKYIVFLMLCNLLPVVIIKKLTSLCWFMYLLVIGYALVLAFATGVSLAVVKFHKNKNINGFGNK